MMVIKNASKLFMGILFLLSVFGNTKLHKTAIKNTIASTLVFI